MIWDFNWKFSLKKVDTDSSEETKISKVTVDDDDDFPYWKYRNEGGGGRSRNHNRKGRRNRHRLKIIRMGTGVTGAVAVNKPWKCLNRYTIYNRNKEMILWKSMKEKFQDARSLLYSKHTFTYFKAFNKQ